MSGPSSTPFGGPPMSTNAPLATLAPQNSVISCGGICQWESPSASNRSDPNSGKVCPAGKPNRVWRDRNDQSQKREFKCIVSTTTSSAQTDICHISELGKPSSGWPADKPYATVWKNECKNTWFRY